MFNQMVELASSQLDLLFYALSDATRRQILELVRVQSRTITELAEPFKMSLAAVSKHIKILERASLITRVRNGRTHECRLDPAALRTAEECLRFYTGFWNEKLDLFEKNLESSLQNERKSHGKQRKPRS
jgi:DNA-binding transcriptional ArsR family regulator